MTTILISEIDEVVLLPSALNAIQNSNLDTLAYIIRESVLIHPDGTLVSDSNNTVRWIEVNTESGIALDEGLLRNLLSTERAKDAAKHEDYSLRSIVRLGFLVESALRNQLEVKSILELEQELNVLFSDTGVVFIPVLG